MNYYDHALNSGPLMGTVIAREQKAAEASGQVYRVEFTTPKGATYWAGGRHTAISLAKTLKFNNYTGVLLLNPNGQAIDIKGATF